MRVQFPYRAVICGEEHIIREWQGRKLITDKGSFFIGHIYGNWQIQLHRLFEVAMIQSDGNGGWLLNGKALSLLETLPAGQRFTDIPKDENLRIYKNSICAVAWCEATELDDRTKLLDSILEFWKMISMPAVKPAQEPVKPVQEPKWFVHFEIMTSRVAFREILSGWSKPIWLTEFRHAAQKIPISPQQKQLANVTTKLNETEEQLRKSQAAASDNLKEALSKWMRFDPPRMSADTKARIEKAVKLYVTEPEKRSLKKIGDEFGVSRKTVSVWFKQFTAETGYPIVTHHHHISVREQSRLDVEQAEEE